MELSDIQKKIVNAYRKGEKIILLGGYRHSDIYSHIKKIILKQIAQIAALEGQVKELTEEAKKYKWQRDWMNNQIEERYFCELQEECDIAYAKHLAEEVEK